ncbi:hypothetical protein ACFQV2_23785 [Actinokineospora soli]|uniref:Uncharacterized protein n=1 Tax=Actinokineospora soli TaxID=1048753 RepID=A0ABW2TQS1_9PSEU
MSNPGSHGSTRWSAPSAPTAAATCSRVAHLRVRPGPPRAFTAHGPFPGSASSSSPATAGTFHGWSPSSRRCTRRS